MTLLLDRNYRSRPTPFSLQVLTDTAVPGVDFFKKSTL
jgi:hypothetical protein